MRFALVAAIFIVVVLAMLGGVDLAEVPPSRGPGGATERFRPDQLAILAEEIGRAHV